MADITARAMNGEIEFRDSLRMRLQLIKGMTRQQVIELDRKITLSKGIQKFLHDLKMHKVRTFLVSGGFTDLAEPLAQQLGFEAIRVNELEYDAGERLTGNVIGPVVDLIEKARWVQEVLVREQLSPHDAIAVGDGANDKAMMMEVAMPVGFRPKASLHDAILASFDDHALVGEFLFSS
jgi:phosphoserine phosphatase